MAYKTIQCVFVPNLKLFRSIKTELWAKEVGKFLLCCMGIQAGGHSPVEPKSSGQVTIISQLASIIRVFWVITLPRSGNFEEGVLAYYHIS